MHQTLINKLRKWKMVGLWLAIFSLQSCFATEAPVSDSPGVSHDGWDKLLKKHVSATGYVDYGGFKKDQAELKKYLTLLEKNAPAKTWSQADQLAYWINAYNAFTVQLILDHASEGIKSIKDIGSIIKIPLINSPWDIKFINIGGQKMDLNTIEHGIIRKQFNEPRIHFALVCAAKSCPPLRTEAYVGAKLSAQLQNQGVRFINDPSKNEVSTTAVKASRILEWYGGDFKQSTVDIVNTYAKTKANKNAVVTFKTYDWSLNGKLN